MVNADLVNAIYVVETVKTKATEALLEAFSTSTPADLDRIAKRLEQVARHCREAATELVHREIETRFSK